MEEKQPSHTYGQLAFSRRPNEEAMPVAFWAADASERRTPGRLLAVVVNGYLFSLILLRILRMHPEELLSSVLHAH
jgi:hypothetical protein